MKSFRNCLEGTLLAAFLAGIALLPTEIFAEIPSELEPDYSEAVLAFNARDFNKSLTLLNELSKKAPKTVEFLELTALALKASKKDLEAASVYMALIETKTSERKAAKDIAPYAFELGMIRYKEKKYEQASQHYEYARKAAFNTGAARFYLGLIAFQAGRWGDAEDSFDGVIASNADDLKPVAHFYLAQTFLKTGYPTGIVSSFISARSAAETVMDDEKSGADAKAIAKQIHEGTIKALLPFDKSAFFGSVSAVTAYDSNVLALPSSLTGANETLGKATMKETFSGGFGYATSPLKLVQFVPSYRGSVNRNFNEDSRSAEFADSAVSLFVTRNPLSRTSYGARGEASILFQNEVTPVTKETKFKNFSHYFAAGPYFKTELMRKVTTGGEVIFKPQTFELDAPSGVTRRSGNTIASKLYMQNNAGRRFWNPTFTLRYESIAAGGADYKSSIKGLQLSNGLQLGDKTQGTLVADYALTGYPDRTAGARNDKTFLLALNATHKLNKKWTVLGSTDYTKNASNFESTYAYSRVSVSTGVSYNF